MPAIGNSGLCLIAVLVVCNGLVAVCGQPTAGGSQNQDCDLSSEPGPDHASIIAEIKAAKVDEASIIAVINASKVDVLKKIQDSISACTNQSSQVCPTASSLPDNCIPLLIQQNVNGSTFFNRSWQEFKGGFNDSIGNFWLGNEILHQLTKEGRYKLRFELQQYGTGAWFWTEYTTFIVLSEAAKYQISIGGYTGNIGYDALAYHHAMSFSTWDRDNDTDNDKNCALLYGGGFWYNGCYTCGVNMMRSSVVYYYWYVPSSSIALQTTRMWLTCR